MESKCGGWSETKPATEETQNICDQVKSKVEKRTGKTYTEFKAIKYREQVVAGMNYLMKVNVGENKYIHLQVWENVQNNLGLTGLEENHTRDDPLEPMETI